MMSDKRANVDREVLMQELEYLREVVVGKSVSSGPSANLPFGQPDTEPLHYCAYNATRERFLGIDVEVADFLPNGLYDHLAALEPRSSMALWITPFRGISPELVHSPVDLVFLDRNYCVLETVESFPLSQSSASRSPADSLLALPAGTVAHACTVAGDQLVLCAPDKIRRRLHILQASKAGGSSGQSPASDPIGNSGDQTPSHKSLAQVIRWEDHARQAQANPLAIFEVPPEEIAPPGSRTPAEAPVMTDVTERPAELSESGRDVAKATKNWLQRWLSADPLEPRSYPREVLPEVVAYFFNGGAPVPCGVRNVSLSGMYINTNERWYLGTIVRMTLTDRRMPVSERAITVNGMVVRWGDDGVGVHFVFQKEKKARRGAPPPAEDEPLVMVTQHQFKGFVKQVKDGDDPLP
jgi:PilZ domain